MSDSDDLKSLGADLPYRHQSFWQMRHDHNLGQDGLCSVALIRFDQPFRPSDRSLPDQQGGNKLFGSAAECRDYQLFEAYVIMDLRGVITQIFLRLIETNDFGKTTLDQLVANAVL